MAARRQDGLHPYRSIEMPKDYSRSDRIAQQMQRELADLIRTELKDPRIGFVTITDVEVTRDLSHAKVFYTLMEGEDDETWKTLSRSSGFLRNELGRRIKMFKMPELHFHYDHSIETGRTLDKLIDQAMQSTGPAEDDETK
jgi:ribosome-binding factor A